VHVLHATALAPGESAPIAGVDGSRKSRAGETEVIDEADELAADSSHNRAISEVTNAVASEAQSGFSHAMDTSASFQTGVTTGTDVSAPFGGLLGGVGFSGGTSTSAAAGISTA